MATVMHAMTTPPPMKMPPKDLLDLLQRKHHETSSLPPTVEQLRKVLENLPPPSVSYDGQNIMLRFADRLGGMTAVPLVLEKELQGQTANFEMGVANQGMESQSIETGALPIVGPKR